MPPNSAVRGELFGEVKMQTDTPSDSKVIEWIIEFPTLDRSGLQCLAKRSLDIVVACASLVLLSPIIIVTAIAIKLQDGGPILHRRRVVGLGGEEFDAFKFRSMIVDADEYLTRRPEVRKAFERKFKLERDPRVTALGKWLRRLSIDELPQLFNVLRGEMSVVGPRMITAEELEKYGRLAGLVLSVQPGVTGYWQVQGRQRTTYEERVRMDEYYIINWSLVFDLKILLKTIPVVLFCRGAS
jgi:lipopolysaccharide/colanic/teichoic acid biosynthesis glycosyltransferase